YEPLPRDTIIDDFVIAMRIAAHGHELVYEPQARAYEETPARIEDEFRRRVRIGLGNYQALFRYPEFLLRTSRARAFAYFSHKILRWFGPHLFALAFVVCAVLAATSPLYAVLFALQAAGVVGILLAAVARKRVQLPRLLSGLVLFAGLNAAFAVAFCKYLFG